MRPTLAAATATRKPERIHTSTLLLGNACTDWMRPVRVVHVARMVSQKVAAARPRAQCLKRPRDLYRVKACSRAVAVSLSLIHISEPTRLGMISYAVFCLKK